MKDTAPISLGVIAVAGLFALIAAGVAFVLYEYEVVPALFIGGIVGAIAAVILLLGWRAPQSGPTGPRDLSPQGKTTAPATHAPAASAPATPASTAAPASAASADVVATPKAAPAPVAEAAPAPVATAAAKPAAKPATGNTKGESTAKPVAADGKPELLTAAREGGPDDLKQIKGVGPKMEGMLHKMGIYHFDQVASWRKKEVEWVDANLEGFKGRVSRDEWVKQAKVLAKGGTTEFSKKVKKGGVY